MVGVEWKQAGNIQIWMIACLCRTIRNNIFIAVPFQQISHLFCSKFSAFKQVSELEKNVVSATCIEQLKCHVCKTTYFQGISLTF